MPELYTGVIIPSCLQISGILPTDINDLNISDNGNVRLRATFLTRMGGNPSGPLLVNLHRECSGRQPNFAVLNRGRHLYSAGRPSRWASAHILVCQITSTTCYYLCQNPGECYMSKTFTGSGGTSLNSLAQLTGARIVGDRSLRFVSRSGGVSRQETALCAGSR